MKTEAPPGVSVVIATRNGASRLPETLHCLMKQQVREEIPWEVVIVSNNSTDDTREVVLKTWQSAVPLKIVDDASEGVAFVRIRGVREARHDIVLYVDDDNRLDPEWVEQVSDFFRTHPGAGMMGGRTSLATDQPPPRWFTDVSYAFAIGEQSDHAGDITESRGYLWGAGMSFRRNVFLSILEAGYTPMLAGRRGGKLTPGEDSEMSFLFTAAGYRIWYIPGLHLRHYMPSARLEWNYTCRLFEGIGESHFILDLYKNLLYRHQFICPRIYLGVLVQFLPLQINRWIRLTGNREGDTRYLHYLMKKATFLQALRQLPSWSRYTRRIRNLIENLSKLHPCTNP